jgi:hypothetical protein
MQEVRKDKWDQRTCKFAGYLNSEDHSIDVLSSQVVSTSVILITRQKYGLAFFVCITQ